MESKYKKHLSFMTKAVKIGYNIVRKNSYLRVIDKGEFDIVTNVDLEIENAIINKLGKLFPQIPVISEESYGNKPLMKNCFVIDPVDGTKNFYHGLPLWGIQMAYLEEGIPVASVLYCPELKLQVVASSDLGTFVNGKRKALEPKNLDHCMIALDGAQNLRWRVASNCDKSIQAVRILSSTCVGFTLVASGILDGYAYMCEHPWDLLPGLCACKNSGLYVYDDNQKMAIVANSARLLEYLKSIILEEMKQK